MNSLEAIIRELGRAAARARAARYAVHALVAALAWVAAILVIARLTPFEGRALVAADGLGAEDRIRPAGRRSAGRCPAASRGRATRDGISPAGEPRRGVADCYPRHLLPGARAAPQSDGPGPGATPGRPPQPGARRQGTTNGAEKNRRQPETDAGRPPGAEDPQRCRRQDSTGG